MRTTIALCLALLISCSKERFEVSQGAKYLEIGSTSFRKAFNSIIFIAMEKSTISMTEVQLRSFVESLRPADEEVRKQLDIGYSWDGQTAVLFEIRPQWNNPTKIMELPFAKLRFVKSSGIWKVYWLLGSGKWRAYEPQSDGTNLPALLIEIQHDPHRCFFG